MSFHFPAPELALYVGHISDDVAEFNIDSPCCFSDDGTPEVLTVLVGTLPGWEFTCTEAPGRCPVWDEMRLVRDLCWESVDCVMQLHPLAATSMKVRSPSGNGDRLIARYRSRRYGGNATERYSKRLITITLNH
mgnify:CR=1 FL=1